MAIVLTNNSKNNILNLQKNDILDLNDLVSLYV